MRVLNTILWVELVGFWIVSGIITYFLGFSHGKAKGIKEEEKRFRNFSA